MQFKITSNSGQVPEIVEADEVTVSQGALMFTKTSYNPDTGHLDNRLVLLVAAQAWIKVTEA